MRNANKLKENQANASFNGSAIDGEQVYAASFVGVFSDGATAGTLKIQASNDNPPANNMAPFVPTNWVDVPNTSTAVAGGASVLITIANSPYRWLRIVWTRTAGAGTVQVYMNLQAF